MCTQRRSVRDNFLLFSRSLSPSLAYSLLFMSGHLARNPKVLKESRIMLSWAVTFLIIALIAGVLGLTGIAGAATQIAWILFVVFLILFLVSMVAGRRVPPV